MTTDVVAGLPARCFERRSGASAARWCFSEDGALLSIELTEEGRAPTVVEAIRVSAEVDPKEASIPRGPRRLRVVHRTQEQVDGPIADLGAVFDPCSTALRKWNPTRMRESPFSSAAWVKLVYERDTDETSVHVLPSGSVMLQFSKLIRSVRKNRRRTWAAAPPSTLCPESCSGMGGVVTNGVQFGSTSVFGLPSVSGRPDRR